MDRRSLAVLVVLLAGCGSDKDSADTGEPDTDTDTDSDTDTDADTDTDTDADADTPPCMGGTGWGEISAGEDAIQVRADGSDDGDGTLSAPLLTLDEALARTREKGATKNIAVGPGTYSVALVLESDPEIGDEATDEGVVIEGCSADEVIFEAADETGPIIKVSGVGVGLSGFTACGGTRSLWFWNGGTSTVANVVVDGGIRTSVIVGGNTTAVTLTDVTVQAGVDDPDDELGVSYGIVAQLGATLTLRDVAVHDARRLGIFADNASVSLTNVEVYDTLPDADDRLGRGIQVQNFSDLSVTGGRLMGNSDAGIMAIETPSLSINSLVVEGTLGAALDGAASSGDGIVISTGAEPSIYGSDFFTTYLGYNDVSGSDRAGILVEHVDATFEENQASDNGLVDESGSSVLYQGEDTIVNVTSGEVSESPELVEFNFEAIVREDL